MKNFLIKMYCARPRFDKLTLYNSFFGICAAIDAWIIFMIAAIYIYDGTIITFWRMICIGMVFVFFQFIIVAVVAYFEDKTKE